MIGALHNRVIAAGVVAALQLAVLGWLVWDREVRVRTGQDVVLEVVPVDPRSLFQGDYVILSYPISTIQAWYGAEPTVGQDVFVTVVPGDKGNWIFATWNYHPDSATRPGGITLKGKVDRVLKAADTNGGAHGEFRVVYGLERFFVPEGQGLGVEQLARGGKLSAIVSVWRDGSSTLKGLMNEGKVIYETGVAAKRPEDVVPLAQQQFETTPVEATPAPEAQAPAVEAPVVEAPVTEAPPASPDQTPPPAGDQTAPPAGDQTPPPAGDPAPPQPPPPN